MIEAIKIIGPVDGYVEEMMDRYNSDITKLAQRYKTNVVVTQRKMPEKNVNALYINSGNITSRLDLNKMDSKFDFARAFYDNIMGNSEVAKKGLKKGFMFMV